MGGEAIWQDYHRTHCTFWIATPDLEEMTSVVATRINQIDSVKSDSIVILLSKNHNEHRNNLRFELPRVAGASRRRQLLEAVLDEPPLVPLLDELEMQGDHLLLQLGDRGLQDADIGEQLLRLQRRTVGVEVSRHLASAPAHRGGGESVTRRVRTVVGR